MAVINVDDIYILDETGAQVDKVTGLFTKDEETTSGEKAFAQLNIGTAGSNRNLLDNPWFTVNQRGVNGTITNGQYGVDRWMAGGGTVTMATGGITLGAGNSYAMQRPADPSIFNGKTVTLSVMTSDGVVESGTVVAQTGSAKTVRTANFELCIGYTAYNSFYFCNTSSSAKTVIAAKLELGSVSTLANDVPPNYAEELEKCKYYYREVALTSAYSMGIGFAYSNTGSVFPNVFGFGKAMRTTPTVTMSGSFTLRNSSNTSLPVTAIYANGGSTGVFSIDVIVASGLTAGGICRLVGDSGAKLMFSADL